MESLCFVFRTSSRPERMPDLAVGTGQRAMHAAAFTKHSTASIIRGHTDGRTSSPELLVEVCISQQLAMSNRINESIQKREQTSIPNLEAST